MPLWRAVRNTVEFNVILSAQATFYSKITGIFLLVKAPDRINCARLLLSVVFERAFVRGGALTFQSINQ